MLSRTSDQVLQLALDNMTQGLSMFDADQRLIFSNRQYAELYELPPELLKPGTRASDIVEYPIERGIFAGERPQAYLKERSEWRNSAGPNKTTHELSDGRTITIVRRLMECGGWVSTHEDITELRRTEALNLRLAKIVEDSINEVFIFDAETLNFLQVNASACRNTGYSAEELKSLTPLDLKPEFTLEEFENAIAPLRSGELSHFRFQTVHRRKDGSLYDTDIVLQLIHDSDRPVFAAIIEDITERKRVERLLETQNERFNVALENIPAGICVYDKEHRLVVSNNNFATMYGVAPNLLKPGTPMKEVMEQRIALGLYAGPSPEQYIQDRLKWVARRQPGFKTETLSDGRTIQITQQPLEDGGWLSIHEDVSERMRAEKALQQSEAQLRAVLDNSPFCVNLKGLEGRYVFANQHYKYWWGLEGEVIGKKLEDVSSDPQRAARVRKSEIQVLETGKPLQEEVSLKRPSDGQIRDRLRIKFPVKAQGGAIVGVGNIAIDITERKNAERAQKKSEELFLKAFHANPLPLSIADAEGRFYDVNDAWLKTFGFARGEVIGRTSGELQLWNRGEERQRFVTHLQTAGALNGFEARFRTKGGEPIDILLSADLVTVDGDQRIFSTCIDVTEDKKSKQLLLDHRDLLQKKVDEATADLKLKAHELEMALAREKELNELQRQFISMASHEFRTPLAIIDQSAQRMLRKIGDDGLSKEAAVPRIAKIRNSVTRMARLMESTLTAARMDEGKVSINVASCDIRRIVMDACARQQEISDTHVISCDLDDLPETIRADSGAIDQILNNLLSNAVKYSPGAPEIEVTATAYGDDVVISVTDHGLGIDEDDLPNMFGRFFRAKTSLGIAGTGIGLHVVKLLTEMHGGSIDVKSRKGEGCTFALRLPIAGPKTRAPGNQENAAA